MHRTTDPDCAIPQLGPHRCCVSPDSCEPTSPRASNVLAPFWLPSNDHATSSPPPHLKRRYEREARVPETTPRDSLSSPFRLHIPLVYVHAFQDLRAGRYVKTHTTNPAVITTCAALGAREETTSAIGGVTLLPSETVEELLTDRRRAELVQPFRLALLKIASQDAARLMAQGDYESALPIALDAVRQGQDLFKPSPAVQLFPLYLLAAQANLGLKRAKACEDFLGIASWLALKEPDNTTNVMRSQLSRLFGQLRAMQGDHHAAIKSFAEVRQKGTTRKAPFHFIFFDQCGLTLRPRFVPNLRLAEHLYLRAATHRTCSTAARNMVPRMCGHR